MPRWPAANNSTRGSVCSVVREQDLQLAEDHIPVLAAGVPVLYDALRSRVKHLVQGIIIGEERLVFSDLSELAVQPLNDVRRVSDPADLRRIDFLDGLRHAANPSVQNR